MHWRRDDQNGSIAGALSPPFHHVHQLDERVGRCGHFVAVRPGCELENLCDLRLGFDASHQFGEWAHLLVYFKDPRVNTWRTVARHCLHWKGRSILFAFDALFGPELGIILWHLISLINYSVINEPQVRCFTLLLLGMPPNTTTELQSWS